MHPSAKTGDSRDMEQATTLTRTHENETLFDLAINLGGDLAQDRLERRGDLEDSRGLQDTLTRWANEFNATHAHTRWGEDADYITTLDDFYDSKVAEYRATPVTLTGDAMLVRLGLKRAS